MANLDKILLFRMTHVENIPHILQHGITNISSPNRNPNYVPIGDKSLINKRNTFKMPNGRTLGEYIPFYFGIKTPMLYVIQNGFNRLTPVPPSKIVYCVLSVQTIEACGLWYVFTDGHALDSFTNFYDEKDIPNFHKLVDGKAIKSTYWKNETDLDLKRRKEAEFLVLGDVPPEAILGFVVFNNEAKQQVEQSPLLKSKQIVIRKDYYF